MAESKSKVGMVVEVLMASGKTSHGKRGAKILMRSLAVSMAVEGTASIALPLSFKRTAPAMLVARREERSSEGADNVPPS